MRRIVASLVFLVGFGGGASYSEAQPMSPEISASAKPVSVSYQNLVTCFPELTDSRLSFKVDLNSLKDLIDDKFITSNSLLRQRKVQYLDAKGQQSILILRTKRVGARKLRTELILQRVDEKGVVTDQKLTENQRINPKQEIVNGLLLGAALQSDEFSYLDSKLNGVSLVYSRNFKIVQDLELTDKAGNRSLTCENQKNLGIICTCSKK